MKNKKILGVLILINLLIFTSLFAETITSEEKSGDTTKILKNGEDLLNKGMYDEAIIEFSNVIAMNPKDNEAYHKRGIAYTKKGNLDQAISDYNKAIEVV